MKKAIVGFLVGAIFMIGASWMVESATARGKAVCNSKQAANGKWTATCVMEMRGSDHDYNLSIRTAGVLDSSTDALAWEKESIKRNDPKGVMKLADKVLYTQNKKSESNIPAASP